MRNRNDMRCIALALVWLVTGLCVAQEDKPVLFADKSPAEIYLIVHRAKWNVDTATVLACTSRRAVATREGAYERLMQERSTLPQALEVINQDVRKTIAGLLLEGRRLDRDTGDLITTRGRVTMVKEDGTWRIRHETWVHVRSEKVP